ncbi:hypothetical protein LCGC14_2669530, partial [marine sediment metagenome]
MAGETGMGPVVLDMLDDFTRDNVGGD